MIIEPTARTYGSDRENASREKDDRPREDTQRTLVLTVIAAVIAAVVGVNEYPVARAQDEKRDQEPCHRFLRWKLHGRIQIRT